MASKKSRILKTLGVIAVVLAVGATIGMVTRPNVQIRVEAPTIEEALAKRLPLSGTRYGVDWTVRDLDFSLLKEGLVRATPNINLQAGRFAIDAEPTAIGRVTYNAGSVFLSEFEVERLNPTSDETGTPSRTAGILRSLIPDSWEQRSRDAAGDAVQRIFENKPVYVLPDTGNMWLAKQAISGVTVSENHIVVSVDPFGLLLRGLIYVGIFLVALIGAIAFVFGMLSSRGGAAAGLAFIALD